MCRKETRQDLSRIWNTFNLLSVLKGYSNAVATARSVEA